MTCPTCGKNIPTPIPGTPGRPRVYCNNLCKQRAWHRRHPQRSVPIGQWLHDCETLIAAMYGRPVSGADIADIEARLRAAHGYPSVINEEEAT